MANLTSIHGDSAASNEALSFSNPPPRFVCPCSRTVIKDPVMSLNTGLNYDRRAVQTWKSRNGDACPLTGQKLGTLVENKALKTEITEWKQQIKGYRRVLRGSPTTYFLVNAKQPARPIPTASVRVSDALEEQHIKAKPEMFSRVSEMISSFTDAGMSDYMSRVFDADKERDWSKPIGGGNSHSKSFKQLKSLVNDATSAGYEYNVEYKSIFHTASSAKIPQSLARTPTRTPPPFAAANNESASSAVPKFTVTAASSPAVPVTVARIPSDLFK